METILGTDWGSYLYHDEQIQFNWQQLHDEAGMRFAVFRGDQELIDHVNGNYSTLRNLEAARRVLPVNGCYYWHYPDASPVKLLERYRKAIDREKPDFIAVDLEQTLVLNPDTGEEEVVNPKKFSDTAQKLCEGLRASYPEKQVVIYTRRDIITKYAPKMIEWIGNFEGGWEAAGIDYGHEKYTLTFEQIKQGFVKQFPSGQFREVDDRGITTIPGWTHNMLHQYSTRILPPYETGTVFAHQSDWNVFFGTVEDMLRWVRKEPQTPRDPRVPRVETKADWATELIAWARRQPDPYTGPGPE
jgi:hypothetical protein